MTYGVDPDDVNPDEYGTDYFEELIQNIDGHPSWEFVPEENKPREELIEAASSFQQDEMFIYHSDTEGVLQFAIPVNSDPVFAASGSLSQPLDGTQRSDPYEGSFGEKVKDAYESVVEKHEAEYLDTGNADPLFQLGIGIPLDYDEEVLDRSLSVASDVARDIEQVNSDVEAVLEQYS